MQRNEGIPGLLCTIITWRFGSGEGFGLHGYQVMRFLQRTYLLVYLFSHDRESKILQ